jgi:hypothetical protein
MDRRISKIRADLQTKLRKLSIEEHNLRKHGLYGSSNKREFHRKRKEIERLNAKYVQLIIEKMAKLHTSRRAPLENLVKTVFHPSRVKRMISTHGINYLNKI